MGQRQKWFRDGGGAKAKGRGSVSRVINPQGPHDAIPGLVRPLLRVIVGSAGSSMVPR